MGSMDVVLEPIELLLSEASKYSLELYRTLALLWKADLLIRCGESNVGIAILREVQRSMRAEALHHAMPATYLTLAEGLMLEGRADEAMAAIDASMEQLKGHDSVLWLPELLRSKGEILLSGPRPNPGAAEEHLRKAMEAARGQSALSWELKAAIPLSRLLFEQGRSEEARSLLGTILSRFTEGFDTPLMVAARKVLNEAPDRR
jgi:predicted ATPase